MSSVVNDRLQQMHRAEAIAFDESLQKSFLHSNLAKGEDILSEKRLLLRWLRKIVEPSTFGDFSSFI